ncbi:MAG TPA: L,D-transpeptidase family protein [Nevskiaceae bacterium]
MANADACAAYAVGHRAVVQIFGTGVRADVSSAGARAPRSARAEGTAGRIPNAILQWPRGARFVVVVDLRHSRLYLLRESARGPRVVESFTDSIGRDGYGKRREGDLRTPVGIYHIERWIPGRRLPPIYGAGAFPLNYPDAWDRARRRTGYGIWIHGVPRGTKVLPPRSSEGCVVLANADVRALRSALRLPRGTPVILTDRLRWRSISKQRAVAASLRRDIRRWRRSWEARDTSAYLAHYAPGFHTATGVDREQFARRARKVVGRKRWIKVGIRDLGLFRYPGAQDVVMAQFIERYRSNDYAQRSRKQQFWQRQPDGRWKIVLVSDGPLVG